VGSARTFLIAFAACLAALAASASPSGAHSAPRSAHPLPAMVTPAHGDGLTRALARGKIDQATYALERAVSLFSPAQVAARYGTIQRPDPREATMVLRDLRLRVGQLSPAQRRTAGAVLARPTTGDAQPGEVEYTVGEAPPECGAHVCVHYVASTVNAATLAQVTKTRDVMEQVWAAEVTARGYRTPLSDLSSSSDGGDARLDVYLADVGSDGLYGYCTSDDPDGPAPPFATQSSDWAVSAYCVLDNDFSPAQFPTNTPDENLEVTAAHEFFHAVQFAYDFAEDTWLMEGTAVWMEDEVYDVVNDNLQYLPWSPLHIPGSPLDRGVSPYHYGAWIWWRYLSERFGPAIVKSVWTRADGSYVGPDQYSAQAAQNAVVAAGAPFGQAFGDFAAWNRVPSKKYSEGASYPFAPASLTAYMGPSHPTSSAVRTVRHLSSVYATYRPTSTATTTGHLTVRVNLPTAAAARQARLIVGTKAGAVSILRFGLNSTGDGALRVAFGRTTIARVDLVVSNPSSVSAGRCWQGTVYSCQGRPDFDSPSYSFSAAYTRT
jgi:hypothetical protein